MALKEKLDKDYIEALKEKDSLRVSVLRLLKTAIKNAEIEAKSELNDEAVISVIEKQAKQRRDSMSQYESAGRDDLKAKEADELKILELYLPEKLSEEEIKKTVKEVYEGLEEAEKSNFGKVMGASMSKLKGQADPNLVSKAVREVLGS